MIGMKYHKLIASIIWTWIQDLQFSSKYTNFSNQMDVWHFHCEDVAGTLCLEAFWIEKIGEAFAQDIIDDEHVPKKKGKVMKVVMFPFNWGECLPIDKNPLLKNVSKMSRGVHHYHEWDNWKESEAKLIWMQVIELSSVNDEDYSSWKRERRGSVCGQCLKYRKTFEWLCTKTMWLTCPTKWFPLLVDILVCDWWVDLMEE